MYNKSPNRPAPVCATLVSPAYWVRPREGFIKLNWNADAFDSKVGLGAVTMDNNDRILAIRCERIDIGLHSSLRFKGML